MTAAPEPRPEHDDPLVQVVEDVDALRRKLDEQGAVAKRTHAVVTQLVDSLAKVVEQGRTRDRRVTLNSFVAYVMFCVLIGGGAVLLYRSRAADLVRARNDALTDLDAARKQLHAAQAELEARDAAAHKAYAFYRLLHDGKRAEAIAAYADLSSLGLTETERDVAAEGVAQAKAQLADAELAKGEDALRKGDAAHAVQLLRHAAASIDSAQLHYDLGVALVRAKDKDVALAEHELRIAIAGKIEAAGGADARYWLGQALEALGRPVEARAEYERFAAAQPMAPLAQAARDRWVALGPKKALDQ